MMRTNSLAMIVLVASAMLTGCGGEANVSSGALAGGHGRLRLAVTEAAKTGEADLPAGSYLVTVVGKVTGGTATVDVGISRPDGTPAAHMSLSFGAAPLQLIDGQTSFARLSVDIKAGDTTDVHVTLVWRSPTLGGVNVGVDNIPSPAFVDFIVDPGPGFDPGSSVAVELDTTNPNGAAHGDLTVQVFLLAMPLDGPPLLVTTLSVAGPVAGSSVPVESYRGTITISAPNGNYALVVAATDRSGQKTTFSKPVNVGGKIAPQPPYQLSPTIATASDSNKTRTGFTLSGPQGRIPGAVVTVWDASDPSNARGGITDDNGRCILDLNNEADGSPVQAADYSVYWIDADGEHELIGTLKLP